MAKPEKVLSWKVVILCFIGAATFWFFKALGKEYSYRIKYPIEFVFDTDSLVAVEPLPNYVDIDVSGGGWDLFKESFWFGADPVIFELENPGAIRFLTRPTILPILTDELSQYRVNFLFTDTLFIDIDPKGSRSLKLALDSLSVDLEEGYRIVSPIEITPDSAILYGANSFLDTLAGSFNITIDSRRIDEDFNELLSLELPDRDEIFSEPSSFRVSFKVQRFESFDIEAMVEMMGFPPDSSVYVMNPNVRLKYVSATSDDTDFTSSDFKVVVDYSMIEEADSTAPAMIVLYPEAALEVEVYPDTLKIFYEN